MHIVFHGVNKLNIRRGKYFGYGVNELNNQ